MPTLDVFKADAFSTASLSASIMRAPYKPSRLGSMGLFRTEGIRTLVAYIEEEAGLLTLLPTVPRGGPPTQGKGPKRKVRPFMCTHIPYLDGIDADDVQGVRAFGSETEVDTVSNMVAKRLTAMRQSMEVTHEWHRMGALVGNILDSDASTVIYNLFTEFGVAEVTQDFAFSVSTTNVRGLCVAVARSIEAELGAGTYNHIHCMCGKNWFDALVAHATVAESFKYQQSTQLREDLRTGFTFGGITFEEMRGTVSGQKFIDDDQCRFFPVGVQDLFIEHYAPANFIETVNTQGQAIYAKQKVRDFETGVDILIQSNPLMMCTRPKVLVKGTKS